MAKLAAYQAKRDFEKTREPKGDAEPGDRGPAESGADSGHAFVVQKHDATRLHYDLRLELDGVMKSWAVTKGPSLVAGEKRLAVHVEDHPVAYNTFEGTIPKGQYGGGTVLVWDRGSWHPETDPHAAYAKGHIDFRLDGEKLGGRWHLVRLRGKPREKGEAWLLVKAEDENARPADAPDILDEKPLSVATGRSLDEVAAASVGAVWDTSRGLAAAGRDTRKRTAGAPRRSGDPDAPGPATRPVRMSSKAARTGKAATRAADRVADPFPAAVEPCLATLADAVPAGPGWLHEIKWDGYRLLAFKKGRTVRLATRRGLDWTARFPAIAAEIAALPVVTAILDGEAVVENENGVADFSALQAALSDEGGRAAHAAVFFAFDLLYLSGVDRREEPLEARKARLAALVPPGPGILRLSEHLEGDGDAMVRSACRLGLEGIVAKRRDRPYRSGRREDWLKIKCTERQEFVVGGFVPSAAGKCAVGSLLLGYSEDGALRHAGRAGTGFTAEAARDLWARLDPARRPTSPFADRLTADEKRGAVFVEPALVAEIEFRGWTGDDHLRHAAFKGLRDDKTVDEVVRERPVHAPGRDGTAPVNTARTVKSAGTEKNTKTTGTAKIAKAGGRNGDTVAGVRLTHPDRALWEGVTKRDLAVFYETIADRILPQIAGRPLSLVRCPNGADGKCFFQKHSWAGLDDAVRRERVRDEDGEEEVLYVETLAGIVGLVQAGVLEIHPWGARMGDLDRPDRLTMDLDPGEGVGWTDMVAGARQVRERLRALGLESLVKTTGGKGLHVVVPLVPDAGWRDAKAFTKALALAMEADSPTCFVAKATKAARRGRIYVDYLRNGRGATAVAAYSTRARPGAPVSLPVSWDELDASGPPGGATVTGLPALLAARTADPWAEIARLDQRLPGAAGRGRTRRSR